MALQKDYKYKGITANYWKIWDYHYEIDSDSTTVVLALYLNKEARDENKFNFLSKIVIEEVKGEAIRSGLYQKLKEKELLINSLDI